MFDSKFIATLFAVAISVIAICNINTNRITSNEGFGFGSLPSTETRTSIIGANSMQDYYDGKTYSLDRAAVENLTHKTNSPNIRTYDSAGLSKTMQDYAERTYNSSDAKIYQDYAQRTYNSPNLDQTYQEYQQPHQSVERYQNNEQENTFNAFPKGEFFSTPSFDSTLSPRFDNVGYGAHISYNYNQLNHDTHAAPAHPLDYGNMVKGKEKSIEPYIAEKSLMKPNYSEGNYNSLAGGDLMVTSDLFPVQNMSSLNSVDKNGLPTQCVFFERIIHSNRNNRRRSQGDPIRGDLPIAPINNGWFNTSANPVDDLQQGAMNVIGGMGSESSKMFSEFIRKAGGKTTVGGVDTAESRSMSTNQNMNTVQVSR